MLVKAHKLILEYLYVGEKKKFQHLVFLNFTSFTCLKVSYTRKV
jgi:hypothetical protein